MTPLCFAGFAAMRAMVSPPSSPSLSLSFPPCLPLPLPLPRSLALIPSLPHRPAVCLHPRHSLTGRLRRERITDSESCLSLSLSPIYLSVPSPLIRKARCLYLTLCLERPERDSESCLSLSLCLGERDSESRLSVPFPLTYLLTMAGCSRCADKEGQTPETWL